MYITLYKSGVNEMKGYMDGRRHCIESDPVPISCLCFAYLYCPSRVKEGI